MSLRDELREQGAKWAKVIGGGLTAAGIISGNRTLTAAGAGALVGGMIADGDRLAPPIRRLHDWRRERWAMFNRRLDFWMAMGRFEMLHRPRPIVHRAPPPPHRLPPHPHREPAFAHGHGLPPFRNGGR